jgi:hypothetical protein
VNGDQVRDTLLLPSRPGSTGYDAREIDGLVHRVAAELDAAGLIRPLVENAAGQAERGPGGGVK